MTFDPAIIDQLNAFRSQGLTPIQAVTEIVKSGVPAVSARDLSIDLATVFAGLTAAELSAILRIQYPDASVLEVAQAVKEALPDTGNPVMYSALLSAGFSQLDAQCGVNILSPVTLLIRSDEPWQNTGVDVTGRQTTTISCSGTWSFNPAIPPCGPAGHFGLVAKPRYTLPGAPEGAMIGRVGNNFPFLVGNSVTAPSGQTGALFLCINDDLNAMYGAGLKDNTGMISVSVVTTA